MRVSVSGLAGRGAALCAAVSLAAVAITPNGAQAAFPGANGDIAYASLGPTSNDIFRIPPQGGTPVNVSSNPGNDFNPSWSPDGLRIAAAHENVAQTQRDIHIYDAATGASTPVTNDAPADVQATWSPDGTMIAFQRTVVQTPPQDVDIYVVPADGSAPPTPLITGTGLQTTPAWSPDGTRLAYSDNSGGNTDVEVVAANGTGPQTPIAQSGVGEFHPDWSPDSSQIVLSRNANILIANADGTGTPQPVVGTAATEENPVWSPDGTKVVFSLGNFPADVATVALDGSDQFPVTSTGDNETGPDWQRVEPTPPTPPTADTTPPETTIVTGPPNKTKKKRASFEFISSEPGSSFECSLDGGAFAPCASGHTFKAKKGRHSFAVRAIDAAANVDPTPARDDWKVRKKRKKK